MFEGRWDAWSFGSCFLMVRDVVRMSVLGDVVVVLWSTWWFESVESVGSVGHWIDQSWTGQT